jgi:hypothetical protein
VETSNILSGTELIRIENARHTVDLGDFPGWTTSPQRDRLCAYRCG